jgi:hypothetical protein
MNLAGVLLLKQGSSTSTLFARGLVDVQTDEINDAPVIFIINFRLTAPLFLPFRNARSNSNDTISTVHAVELASSIQ